MVSWIVLPVASNCRIRKIIKEIGMMHSQEKLIVLCSLIISPTRRVREGRMPKSLRAERTDARAAYLLRSGTKRQRP